ncbi:MAG: DMT family transporter [Alphaproteobacteria bacterium]
MTAREWALLLALSVLWGGTFLFVGIAVAEVPPFTIVFVRVGLAALALGIVLRLGGGRLPSGRRVWVALAGMALINNVVPFSLLVWGQTQIASGLAAILNAATPIFTVFVAHALTADERLTPARLAGAAIGLAGVAVLVGPSAVGLGEHALAELACLCAALSYAFAAVFGRRFRRLGIAPLPTATGQAMVASLILLPFALVVDRPWTLAPPHMTTVAALAALALLSTALAYVIYFRILATAGATNLMLVTLLVPPTALVLGVVVLGERPSPVAFAGLALISLGLAAIDGRPVVWLRGLTRRPGPA